MVTQQTDFERLMERVRAGSPEAAREVFDRYSGHIRRIVRRRLQRCLRRQFDSLDFVQSVWASFFHEGFEQRTFASPEALVAFLSRVAYNKVVETSQRLHADRRDIQREESLDPDGDPEHDVPEDRPTPSQVAMAGECWERLLAGRTPRERWMLEMLRQGHSHGEIAERLGLHPKIVQRLLRKLTDRMGPP